ncbi:MAG: hypothetical protein ACWA5P_00705 [bacterium]
MKNTILSLFCLFGLLVNAQNIDGFVYDEDGPVVGVRILNENTSTVVFTDAKGNYKLSVSKDDTLIISSSLHEEKTIIVNDTFMANEGIIQLKQITTQLSEVEINVVLKKIFDSISYQNQLNQQAKQKIGAKSIISNGEFNQPTMNLLVLAEALGVFSGKNKNKAVFISSKELETLFETSTFFTEELLARDLKITSKQKGLFFDYCGQHQLDKALLAEDQQLQLLDALQKRATSFKAFIEEPTED